MRDELFFQLVPAGSPQVWGIIPREYLPLDLARHRGQGARDTVASGRDRAAFRQVWFDAEGATAPGNSQAKGPRRQTALESGRVEISNRPTEGVNPATHPVRGCGVYVREISQVQGQRGVTSSTR